MSLKVIGAGLGRTGTASIKVALEQLGVGRCYHMGEILRDPSQIDGWLRAADGTPDWGQLLEGFSATVDYPACSFWRELADHYPDAKVLLSVRDATSWFESTNETIMSPDFNNFIRTSPFGELNKRTVWDTLDGRMGDQDFMVDYFQRRTEEISQAIPPERLLIYEVRDGWAPLCEFLDLPVPATDFPRINSREDTRRLVAMLMSGAGGAPDEQSMSEAANHLFGDVAD